MTVGYMKTALRSTLRSNWARFPEKPKIRKDGYSLQTHKIELNYGPKHLRISQQKLRMGGKATKMQSTLCVGSQVCIQDMQISI